MGVHHALGLTRRAARIAEPHRRVLVDLRPCILGGPSSDERLVINGFFEAGFAPFAVTANDNALN